MRFDLKKLLLRGPDHVREKFTADLSGRDWPGYRVSQPVSALFEAWVQGSEVFLELQATAELSGECARCLDPVTQECSLTRSWKVKEHDLAGEDWMSFCIKSWFWRRPRCFCAVRIVLGYALYAAGKNRRAVFVSRKRNFPPPMQGLLY